MSVIYDTTTPCGDDEVLSMKFNVLCDASMEIKGDDTFVPARMTRSNLVGCQKFMEFEHFSGCTKFSALGFTNFLNTNVWLSGTLLIAAGLIMGIKGQQWFLRIAGTFAATGAFVAWMVMASILAWLNTWAGMIICSIVGVGFGVLAFWLIARPKFAVMLLSIGGGFFLGSMFEGLVIAVTGWESLVFFIIVTIGFCVTGAYFARKHPHFIKKWLTSMMGSYLFMRGWTYYFGGYPSEVDMYYDMINPEYTDLEFTTAFWVYVALFFAGIYAFVYIQTRYAFAKYTGEDHGYDGVDA
jgi:hypothetical protein